VETALEWKCQRVAAAGVVVEAGNPEGATAVDPDHRVDDFLGADLDQEAPLALVGHGLILETGVDLRKPSQLL